MRFTAPWGKRDVPHGMAGLISDVLGAPRHPARSVQGEEAGRGRLEAVPGTPDATLPPLIILGLLRGRHHRLVGIEGLFALLAAGKIAFRPIAGAELVGAEQRLERAVDLGQHSCSIFWR